INLGAFLAPLITGPLGQKINWHIGFAAAGVGLIFGRIHDVMGKKYLVAASGAEGSPTEIRADDSDKSTAMPVKVEAAKAPLTRVDWARIGAVVILTLFALLFWAGFEQAGSSLTLFADRAT